MGVRRIAALVSKKRQNILDTSNVVQLFGKSCDTAASMKFRLLRDINSSVPEAFKMMSLSDLQNQYCVTEVNVEPFIEAFINAGMKSGHRSVLEHLCADIGDAPMM